MTYRVFVTRDLPDKGLRMLKTDRRIQLEIYKKDQKIPTAELLKRVRGKDIILSILTERMDKKVFDAAGRQLKMVANYAVGFDNVDLKEAAQRKIVVTNAACPEISETVAEHTIALIFSLLHRIPECDRFARAGKYKAWGPKLLLGTDLIGKTVGLIGTGAIGSAVARRLRDGFGVKIVYHDVKRNLELEKKMRATYLSKDALLKTADIVSLHVPLLPATHHLISIKELRLMKPTAFLINTARGPVVNEKILLKALAKKQIAGAGIDVFECEPLIDCDPSDTLELRKMDNVVLTPHTASATIETRQAMSRTAAENILAFIKGKTPPNIVR